MSKDWDAELSKIDKQIRSLPDDRLLPERTPVAPGKGAPAAASTSSVTGTPAVRTSTLGVTMRLALATSLAVGILFWPYQARCGLGLAGYLGAVGVVAVAGIWSGIWSWRHRAARAHVLSLLLVLWGLVLASIEVLPRTGIVTRAGSEPVAWVCQ